MVSQENIIPTIGDIMRQTPAIGPGTLVRDVMELFQNQPSLLALPVNDADRYLGVINRKALFFEHLGRPFAVDLYAKKPITSLLADNGFNVEPELDINAALGRLLAVDPELAMDSFPVVSDARCHGIVAVSDLMMQISQSQSALLQTLKLLSARITEEVAKASIIQRDLLPPSEQIFDAIEISAELITSSEIGGDFYDYFRLDDGRIGFVVADVSGHGVQAGMVTT
ncbi:MAG: CBS domain-containing protein, partial [Geobacter sp.]|nr:CBS domain-containing protein [Geobacter sp.]